jgi:chromosome segregation ATPase
MPDKAPTPEDRITELAQRVQQLADSVETVERAFGNIERRVTATEESVGSIGDLMPGIRQRLEEFAGAAQGFNSRVGAVEQAMIDLQAQEPEPAEERLRQAEEAVAGFGRRLTALEAGRSRLTLADRLARVEEEVTQLKEKPIKEEKA